MKNKHSPFIHKVRRIPLGGKRADGHDLQKVGKQAKRRDPLSIHVGKPDPSLTGMAGILDFDRFVHEMGLPAALSRDFDSMKQGSGVVYSMSYQLHLLLIASAAGMERVFDLEGFARDPLFVMLAGGQMPSVDVFYDDMKRFDLPAIGRLSGLLSKHGVSPLRSSMPVATIDLDTSVCCMFGSQEGAVPGYNPRYHGRPSYHPMLARIAETDTILAAQLRSGDTGFGVDDVPTVIGWVRLVREKVGPNTLIRFRIDSAGDCTSLLSSLEDEGVLFVTKAKLTQDLCDTIALHSDWRTVDEDADGKPTRQVATIKFQRKEWEKAKKSFRVVVMRQRDRETGKQTFLWNDLEYSVQAYITNDKFWDEEDIVHHYNQRCGIEPLIAELKQGWTVGKFPSHDFNANHAMLLLKLLAYNLQRHMVRRMFPTLHGARWRASWIRRAVILRPGRLIRSGRQTTIRYAGSLSSPQVE
jgi:hypothetical protein